LAQGYLNALENDGADKLAMSKETYEKSKTYLTTLKNNIQNIQQATTSTPNKVLLADNSCPTGNCPPATDQTLTYQPDISAYVQGIFVET
jgi:hypothetical protein